MRALWELGDRGQRYEVRCKAPSPLYGERDFVVGWSETTGGASQLVRVVEAHPSWHTPVVVDRQERK